MKSQKTYNSYKKYLYLQFQIGYSQSKAIQLFSKRFHVSKKYSEEVTFLFYNKILNTLSRKDPWPIVNL